MKSKNLSKIQFELFEAVTRRSSSSDLINYLVDKPPISIASRLEIYQDAYRVRLFSSLKDDFDRVRQLAGKEKSEFLMNAFIDATPSIFRNLAEYSQNFPAYLKMNAPELFEAGVLDWAEILSEYAAEPDEALSAIDIQAGISFTVKAHPASHLCEVGDKRILVFRFNNECKTKELSATEAELFKFFRQNKTFDDLSYFAKSKVTSNDVFMQTISEWIELKIIYCARGAK